MAVDNTAKINKLLALQRELLEKLQAVTEELIEVAGGGAGTAAHLKQLEGSFDRAWCERYAPGQTGRYVWSYTRDRPQMKRLLKSLGLEELGRRMWSYVRNEDPYFVRSRHSFGSFVATINQHAGEAAAPADLELDARPVGCSHVPPCTSDQQHTKARAREMRA